MSKIGISRGSGGTNCQLYGEAVTEMLFFLKLRNSTIHLYENSHFDFHFFIEHSHFCELCFPNMRYIVGKQLLNISEQIIFCTGNHMPPLLQIKNAQGLEICSLFSFFSLFKTHQSLLTYLFFMNKLKKKYYKYLIILGFNPN